MLGARTLGAPPFLSATLGFATIVVLRLVSVRFGVRVPDPVWLEPTKSASRSDVT